MARKRKRIIPPADYVGRHAGPRDFAGTDPHAEPTPGTHPTAIAIACTNCNATGTVDMPLDVDVEKLAGKMLHGKIVKGYCLNCKLDNVEFRPFTPKELKKDGLRLVGRIIANSKHLKVDGEDGKLTVPSEAVKNAIQASNEYVEDVKRKLAEKEGDGSIILP